MDENFSTKFKTLDLSISTKFKMPNLSISTKFGVFGGSLFLGNYRVDELRKLLLVKKSEAVALHVLCPLLEIRNIAVTGVHKVLIHRVIYHNTELFEGFCPRVRKDIEAARLQDPEGFLQSRSAPVGANINFTICGGRPISALRKH